MVQLVSLDTKVVYKYSWGLLFNKYIFEDWFKKLELMKLLFLLLVVILFEDITFNSVINLSNLSWLIISKIE